MFPGAQLPKRYISKDAAPPALGVLPSDDPFLLLGGRVNSRRHDPANIALDAAEHSRQRGVLSHRNSPIAVSIRVITAYVSNSRLDRF
jgi:hypothetical protein